MIRTKNERRWFWLRWWTWRCIYWNNFTINNSDSNSSSNHLALLVLVFWKSRWIIRVDAASLASAPSEIELSSSILIFFFILLDVRCRVRIRIKFESLDLISTTRSSHTTGPVPIACFELQYVNLPNHKLISVLDVQIDSLSSK